jgi:hypothetical protein
MAKSLQIRRFCARSPVEVSCPTATRGFMSKRLLLAAVAAAAEARLAKRMHRAEKRRNLVGVRGGGRRESKEE